MINEIEGGEIFDVWGMVSNLIRSDWHRLEEAGRLDKENRLNLEMFY